MSVNIIVWENEFKLNMVLFKISVMMLAISTFNAIIFAVNKHWVMSIINGLVVALFGLIIYSHEKWENVKNRREILDEEISEEER